MLGRGEGEAAIKTMEELSLKAPKASREASREACREACREASREASREVREARLSTEPALVMVIGSVEPPGRQAWAVGKARKGRA